jgi:hypothetical protein
MTYVLKEIVALENIQNKHRRNLEKAIEIAEKSTFIDNLRLGAYIGKGKDGLSR